MVMSAYTFSTSPVYYAVYKIIEPNQCNTVLKHYTNLCLWWCIIYVFVFRWCCGR